MKTTRLGIMLMNMTMMQLLIIVICNYEENNDGSNNVDIDN